MLCLASRRLKMFVFIISGICDMRKLLIFELKKNIFKLSILILFLCLVAVNFYKIHETVRVEGKMGAVVSSGETDKPEEMKAQFYGEINDKLIKKVQSYSDKMSAIIDSGNFDTKTPSDEFYTGFAYGDNNVIKEIMNEIRAAYLYPNRLYDLCNSADECIAFFEDKDKYEVRKNELMKEMYNGRKITEYRNFEAIRLFCDYEFSSLLVIIMLIFAFSATYSNEKLTSTDKIIKSCGCDKKTFIAKHISLVLFVAILVLFFTVIDLIGFGNYYGISSLNLPLYSIEEYRLTPFNITILGAIGLSCVFKFIAFLFLGELIIFISAFTKNHGVAMAVSFVLIGVIIFAGEYIPSFLSPISLVNTENMLKEFKCVNMFGEPLFQLAVNIMTTVTLTVILHCTCFVKIIGSSRLLKAVKSV